MNLGEWLASAADQLARAGVESARMEAQILAAHALHQDRAWVLTHPEAEAPPDELLERRVHGEPLAYILGYREFFGRRFSVESGVLIPRQETEVLVEVALGLAWQSALDVGCGSGCIGLTLALERPAATVTLSDLSAAALRVSRGNAQALGANVAFAHGDLIEATPDQRFDLVVSNPPYVAQTDPLPDDVRLYEPSLALFAEEHGLAIYRRLAHELRGRTCQAALEIGMGQAPPVREIFQSCGWRCVLERPDLAGIPRVLVFDAP